jgi:hypothetical protein
MIFNIVKASESNNVNSNRCLLHVVYRGVGASIRGGPEIYLLTAASTPALESTQRLTYGQR